MIINHQQKLAVSFAPKTGSTTIRSVCLKNGYLEVGEHHSMFFGAIPPDYGSCLTVRNPFSRAVSMYWHLLWSVSDKLCPQFHLGSEVYDPLLPSVLEAGVSFDRFVYWLTNGADGEDFYRRPQTWWYRHAYVNESNVMVIKLESIDFDLRNTLALKGPFPQLNKTNHRHWPEYYTPENRLAILRHFSEDFEAYGYSTTIGGES